VHFRFRKWEAAGRRRSRKYG